MIHPKKMYRSWEDVIRSNFQLGAPNAKGWHSLRCPVCGDKQKRAGFIFNSGSWGFNCFRGRCMHRVRYNDTVSSSDVAPAIDKLFSSVGLREEDWTHLFFDAMFTNKKIVIPDKPKQIVDPKEVKLPFGAHKLLEANPDNVKTEWAIDYLMNRGVDPQGLTYYVTNAIPPKDMLDFRNRVIIPFYYKGKLIFFQGAWTNPDRKTKLKYLNVKDAERESVFFNMDELDRETDEPLFIIEGVFDALWFHNAVSCLSNTLTEQQIARLKKCGRRIIMIPDHDKAGAAMVKTAIAQNWDVSNPDWSSDIKDTDDAVRRYGKLQTVKTIMDAILTTEFEKQLLIETLILL